MQTAKVEITDKIPYNHGIGNEVTFWAFQAPETQEQDLVLRILNMVETKNSRKNTGLKFNFCPYKTSETAPWQIPQKQEELTQVREALLVQGITLGLRYLNSKRLNIDTLMGMVPERVMDCPYEPTLIDITDQDKMDIYLESMRDRYRKQGLDIAVEKHNYLRSIGEGIVPYREITVPQRSWKRVVLGYDPKNELLMKIFKSVVSNKILEYLINKGKSELSALPTVPAPRIYTPKPIVPAPIVKKDPRKTQKQEPVTDKRKTQKLDPIR